MAMRIRVKRVYESAEREDGIRVLVDRLWPRGVAKEKAAIDLWLKEIAPSSALRHAFHGDPERWDEFRRRYARELDAMPDAVAALRVAARGRTLTLLYASRDPACNNAVALADYLRRRRGAAKRLGTRRKGAAARKSRRP
jgi:uncharacterized protein YeaO (DUF488 family)